MTATSYNGSWLYLSRHVLMQRSNLALGNKESIAPTVHDNMREPTSRLMRCMIRHVDLSCVETHMHERWVPPLMSCCASMSIAFWIQGEGLGKRLVYLSMCMALLPPGPPHSAMLRQGYQSPLPQLHDCMAVIWERAEDICAGDCDVANYHKPQMHISMDRPS